MTARSRRRAGASIAAAFPQVAATNSATSGGGTTATHNVNLPAGITAGDLLVIVATAANTITAGPAGFTEIFNTTISGSVGMLTLAAWYKVATGSEGATTSFTTASSVNSASSSYRITGWQGTPEGATADGTSANGDPPNLTPTWGNNRTLWIAGLSLRSGTTATISSAPTNYTDLIQTNSTGGTAANQVRGASCRREKLGASEDPDPFILSVGTQNWVAGTIAIRPA